jgi:hypothetical protein
MANKKQISSKIVKIKSKSKKKRTRKQPQIPPIKPPLPTRKPPSPPRTSAQKPAQKQTKYEICKQQNMKNYMGRFKEGKLKANNKKIVRDRRQALAIAIRSTEKKCNSKMKNKDFSKIEKILQRRVQNNPSPSLPPPKTSTRKKSVLSEPLSIIDVKRSIQLMKKYKQQRKPTKLKNLQRDLMARILMNIPLTSTKTPIPKIIIRSIQEYLAHDY